MPKRYAYNTSATQIKKRYAMIGSTATQVKKRYAMIGSTATLVFNSEYNALAEGGWTTKKTYTDVAVVESPTQVAISTNGTGYQGRLYKKVDVTNYTKMTITYNAYFYYGSWGFGLTKNLPADYSPQGIDVGVTSDTYDVTKANDVKDVTVKDIDISGLSGEYYVFVGAYQGSNWETIITVKQFLLE